jgi:hypothetical protein
MRSLLLVVLAIVASPPVAGEDEAPRVEISVAPEEATVGDLLETRVSIVVPPDVGVEKPEPGPEWGPFAVNELAWEGPEELDGRTRWVWHGTLAAFETGTLEVSPLEIRLVSGDERSVIRTEPVEIEIVSVIAPDEEEPEIADLKAPASVPADYRALLTALAVVVGLLILSGLAWWLHRRFAAKLAAVPQMTDPFHRMPPHEWVYEQLRMLLERRLAEQGEVEEFFSELSHIVKQYLGGRYRVDLLERTTSEVRPELDQAGAPPEPVRATVELLERADTVKFARGAPDPAACRAAVEEAYRIVDATRPVGATGDENRGAA